MHHLNTFGPDTPPVGPDDVNLHFHALQWATGFQTMYPYLIRGARSVLLDDARFDPDLVVDTILREIAVRSAMSLGEYWDMPDKTLEASFPGDWYRPFDVGYLDEDGFLYYADRAGDTIHTSAGAVYPHLVEAALFRHEAVANCGVVGLGEPGAQRVVAAVQLKPGWQPTPELATTILATTCDDLAARDRPVRLAFLSELPTVSGGAKVQRQALRERLETS
jgi:acyl-coenzyme A synthetase/AMP-(fatty) acid ligase